MELEPARKREQEEGEYSPDRDQGKVHGREREITEEPGLECWGWGDPQGKNAQAGVKVGHPCVGHSLGQSAWEAVPQTYCH